MKCAPASRARVQEPREKAYLRLRKAGMEAETAVFVATSRKPSPQGVRFLCWNPLRSAGKARLGKDIAAMKRILAGRTAVISPDLARESREIRWQDTTGKQLISAGGILGIRAQARRGSARFETPVWPP